MGVDNNNNNNNNNNNDGESPWESATNDQAFRETVTAGAGGRREGQATGEISNEQSVVPSPPSSPVAVAVTSVRWELEEDNSNNIINGNYANNANDNDVSFLTSETMSTNYNANANAATNANSSSRRNNRGGGRARSSSSSSDSCFSKLSLKHILHIWDITLTLFWMIFIGYHLYYNKDNEPSRSTSMAILLIICCVLAVLNLLRGLLWLWTTLPSLSTICCCGCFFDNNNNDNNINNDNESSPTSITVWKISTNLTLSLGIAYGITAGIGWFGPLNWLPWCDGLTSWCTTLPTKFMPIVLTVSSVIELLRWIFLMGRLSSLSYEQVTDRRRSSDYYNDEYQNERNNNDFNASSPSETSRHRPWWWNRRSGGSVSSSSSNNNNNNNELHDPLLDGNGVGAATATADVGGQPAWTTMSSWIPFSPSRQQQRQQRRYNSTNIDNDNATGTTTVENNRSTTTILNGDEDDVESVLDSLGEDWASRTEDDPNWWTR
jgi:hypothetical protein